MKNKRFNITGACFPDEHYMVDISERLEFLRENADLAAAKLAVVDAAEEEIFTETLKNLKKDQPATVEWDGKSGDTYALSGDYTVVVSAGEKETIRKSFAPEGKNGIRIKKKTKRRFTGIHLS